MRRAFLASAALLLASCAASPPELATPEEIRQWSAWSRDASSTIGSHYVPPNLGREFAARAAATVVSFSVDKSGQITDPEVTRSSSYPNLDEAAVRAVRAASPLTPPPPASAFRVRSPSDPFQVQERTRIRLNVPVMMKRWTN